MKANLGRLLVSLLAIGVVSFAAVATANAAKTHKSHAARAGHVSATKSKRSRAANPETPLTGATLASASAAALAAVPGGTVDRATTESDGTGAYEVIVKKPDGSHAKVVESASFAALSVAATGCH